LSRTEPSTESLTRRFASPPPARLTGPVQAAVVCLRDPTQRVERLAEDLGLSERQLRRRFQAAVGYGPKTLQRILRLRRFRVRAGAGADAGHAPLSLAEAAFDAGYADQAHLARECRALTELSAGELIATHPTRVTD